MPIGRQLTSAYRCSTAASTEVRMSSPLIALVMASKLASRSQQSTAKAKELLTLPTAHFLLDFGAPRAGDVGHSSSVAKAPFCLRDGESLALVRTDS